MYRVYIVLKNGMEMTIPKDLKKENIMALANRIKKNGLFPGDYFSKYYKPEQIKKVVTVKQTKNKISITKTISIISHRIKKN